MQEKTERKKNEVLKKEEEENNSNHQCNVCVKNQEFRWIICQAMIYYINSQTQPRLFFSPYLYYTRHPQVFSCL